MIACEHCGSTNVVKSSAVYDQGVTHSTSKTTAVGITMTGVVGAGVANTEGVSTTRVAELNRPPSSPGGRSFITDYIAKASIWTIILAFLFPAIFGGFFGVGFSILIGIALGFLLPWFDLKSNEEIDNQNYESLWASYNARAERYSRQWYCASCGELFWTERPPARETAAIQGASDWS